VTRHQKKTFTHSLPAIDVGIIQQLITFRVSRRPREMYCGHARLCVCVSVCLSAAACPHYCTDPGVTWGSGRGCPLVVHYWADLQSVHGIRCYGNIMECMAEPSGNPPAQRTPHALRTHARTHQR